MIEAVSSIATITFDGQLVTITRPKSARSYRIDQITGLQWRAAGLLYNGYLRLAVRGVADVRGKGGRVDLLRDELAAPFTRGNQPAFEQVRAAIEQALAQ